MRAFFSMDLISARFLCLILAVVVYALCGSPTPNAPGFTEVVIALLLLCAAGVPGVYSVFRPREFSPLWIDAGRWLLFYGLTICFIGAALRGHDRLHILRDAAPFLFFLLPLFLHGLFTREKFKIFFALALVFSGLVFAVRSMPEILGWWVPNLYSGELYYFANAPSVLFAVLFLAGTGAALFVAEFSPRAILLALVCFVLAVIPFTILLFSLQRASAAMAVLGVSFLLLAGFFRYPGRTAVLITVILLFLLPIMGFLDEFRAIMMKKTGEVGLNMRGEEVKAAWNAISGDPLSVFFGMGWGGTFESPAVAGIRVNYTHSLLSAMLLKTGLVGLGLTILYLAGLAYGLLRSMGHNIVLAVALAGPIVIDVFLYASYKSLDFGLILLLAAVTAPAAISVPKVAPQRGLLYSN